MSPVALVDLEVSNLGSVRQALLQIGAPPHELATVDNLATARAILLPGVGAYADGMASLRAKGLIEPLRRAAHKGTPILGICLGMQLLARKSEEYGTHAGLGLLAADVIRLAATEPGFRVPNIGWCDVEPTRPSKLFPRDGGCFYHVHSFHVMPDNAAAVAATIAFSGTNVVVAIECGNLYGVQFHPEKSQDDGLEVLANFFASLQRGERSQPKAAA
jgi:glutamine amidotransferase